MTELLALLTTAKDAGFEVGSMATLAIIYWRLDARIKKKWDELIAVLGDHNKKNDERFNKIETHIGIKK